MAGQSHAPTLSQNGAVSAHREVLVVGAGPAGMQAAWTAASSGAKVTLIDDNPSMGGQIWRGEKVQSAIHRTRFEKLRRSNVRLLLGYQVVDTPSEGELLAVTNGEPERLRYDRLILATGARERFLPFPGWTLPNVYGVGGLQAMVKGGLDVKGKRVVVCGSGPLLLSVAASLRKAGAEVPLIAEQTNLTRLIGFLPALRHAPGKFAEMVGLLRDLTGAGFRSSCYPVRANGVERLVSLTLREGGQEWTVPCDFVATGFGFVPNIELALLLGCSVRGGTVIVDEWQRTSMEQVYCAGEPTGIGGVEKSLVEGSIAGLAASGAFTDESLRSRCAAPFAERARLQRFAAALDATFALRKELRTLAKPETVVCRCEDVASGQLAEHGSWRSAKLHTRLGMGRCQGRICGGATGFLYGWPMESVRPPLFPVRVGTMAGACSEPGTPIDPGIEGGKQ